jgi:putative tryptophan/tyrosine transport system substrate-binding protein
VALIYDPNPAIQFINRPELEAIRTAANRLGLSFDSFECGSPEAFEETFSKASRSGAAIVGNSGLYPVETKRIAQRAIAVKLAAISWADIFPAAGLLMSYGANEFKVTRDAAPLVKKILEGEKPGDIPVQQPTAFDLVYNLKTAQILGLQIPSVMLAQATRIIE